MPKFEGNKLEFQQWYTTFISCVDETAMMGEGGGGEKSGKNDKRPRLYSGRVSNSK